MTRMLYTLTAMAAMVATSAQAGDCGSSYSSCGTAACGSACGSCGGGYDTGCGGGACGGYASNCGGAPSGYGGGCYQSVERTIMVPQQVTAYRTVTRTAYRQEQRERSYTVAITRKT